MPSPLGVPKASETSQHLTPPLPCPRRRILVRLAQRKGIRPGVGGVKDAGRLSSLGGQASKNVGPVAYFTHESRYPTSFIPSQENFRESRHFLASGV